MNKVLQTSPSFLMNTIEKIEKNLWEKFPNNKYKNVLRYIKKWHAVNEKEGNASFYIQYDMHNINLSETLDSMSEELLFRVALDLGIELPNVIHAVPEIKRILADKYTDAHTIFENANKKIYEDPSGAIIMANSALEVIIKRICENPQINSANSKDTLYGLTHHILKQFNFFQDLTLNKNINSIPQGLLKSCQAIESIRSNNTQAHGTLDEIINDPIYAMLIVNAVSTIGIFLLNYYEKTYLPKNPLSDDIPF
ncbi:MAG: hypothetical protein CMH30_03455 [Micavibrio sp.]|nr:hypothetical protein [Micavibrio sp.]|tara:strand:- start:748 stop:1506 length:759 start_codon:yes stop_codon:yes gene_type:complete